MSILSALIPLALSLPQALASPAPAAVPEPVAAPVATAPAITPIVPMIDAKVAPAKPVAKPTPAVATPGQAEMVKIQAPAAMDRNAIIDHVAKALTETKTVSGRFTQVDPQNASSSGAFYISRPGKVRFEYTSPEPIFIVSDGTTVSIEEPKRKAYDAIPLASTPLNLFLRSNVDLKKDGNVTDVRTANGSHYVTLVDKTGEAEGQMVLQFRASDFELLGWRQVDGTGAETKVQLADVKKNVALKASLFVVKDPADVDDDRR